MTEENQGCSVKNSLAYSLWLEQCREHAIVFDTSVCVMQAQTGKPSSHERSVKSTTQCGGRWMHL